ncbi:hypothetical protein [Cellulomonas sp. 179-A 4D5 NHS]|uniref:hypothetical protein n=1 Tax=Cellulomonas sp. 179-A 4D5 NHS TaxID=3142378 RepID=UPI0039A368A6
MSSGRLLDADAVERARRAGAPMGSERDAVVTGTASWGATVRLPGGAAGLVDHLQGGASLAVGALEGARYDE